MVLRVQPMKYNMTQEDLTPDTQPSSSPPKRGSESPRKSSAQGSSSPRKQSRESPTKSKSNSQPRSGFRKTLFPQQPSTIYMDMTDVENQLHLPRSDIPHVFYAKLHKLKSPKEATQEKHNVNNKSNVSEKGGNTSNKTTPSTATPTSPTHDLDLTAGGNLTCVVRVIVIDRRRQLCSESYSCIVQRLLQEQPLLKVINIQYENSIMNNISVKML